MLKSSGLNQVLYGWEREIGGQEGDLQTSFPAYSRFLRALRRRIRLQEDVLLVTDGAKTRRPSDQLPSECELAKHETLKDYFNVYPLDGVYSNRAEEEPEIVSRREALHTLPMQFHSGHGLRVAEQTFSRRSKHEGYR